MLGGRNSLCSITSRNVNTKMCPIFIYHAPIHVRLNQHAGNSDPYIREMIVLNFGKERKWSSLTILPLALWWDRGLLACHWTLNKLLNVVHYGAVHLKILSPVTMLVYDLSQQPRNWNSSNFRSYFLLASCLNYNSGAIQGRIPWNQHRSHHIPPFEL